MAGLIQPAAAARERGRRFVGLTADTGHHLAMIALMAWMLVQRDHLTHLLVLAGLIALAGVAASRIRRGVDACTSSLADAVLMAVLTLTGVLGGAAGGHHGAGLIAPPLWAVDAAAIAVWAAVQVSAVRASGNRTERTRVLMGCAVMTVQIVVMLLWCR